MQLFAYRDYSKEPDYYSRDKAFSEGSSIISSEPRDENTRWEMMAKEKFLVIDLGDSACNATGVR